MYSSRIPTPLTLWIVASTLLHPSNALASWRMFPDLTQTSADGTLRVEARSIDNQPTAKEKHRFAGINSRNFVYSLYADDGKRLLWQRKLDLPPPIRLLLDNSGWVVAEIADLKLAVLRPETGEIAMQLDLEILIPSDERRRFVTETTGGPIWDHLSRWYFHTNDDKRWFVLRCWWGRRIVIDLQDLELVRVTGKWETLLDQDDRKFVRRMLRGYDMPRFRGLDEEAKWETRRELITAVYLAGKLRMKEALPAIRGLAATITDFSLCYSMEPPTFESEKIDRRVYEVSRNLQLLKLSSRRLGEPLIDVPAIRFPTKTTESQVERRFAIVGRDDRARDFSRIKPGMTPTEVVESIGEPDCVPSFVGPDCWDYDVDVAQPFTLRVIWGSEEEQLVREVKRFDPPLWKKECERDAQVIQW